MELREPPKPATRARAAVPWYVWTQLGLLAAVALLLLLRSGDASASPTGARELAAKLRAAGALDQAAAVLETHVASLGAGAERASAAYSLGETYLDLGDTAAALRWFYDAEEHDDGALREDLARRIVHALERLGRFQAAQSALESRVRLGGADEAPEDDVIVARIEGTEIRRSDLQRAMDDLPPAMAASLRSPDAQREFLRKYVADELLWRKAVKLEYDRDPELERQFERTLRQMVISRFLEREVLGNLEADESDLRNFFEAHRERYRGDEVEGQQVRYEAVRDAVQRDYLQQKAQSAYQDQIDAELQAADVELFPQRLVAEEGP